MGLIGDIPILVEHTDAHCAAAAETLDLGNAFSQQGIHQRVAVRDGKQAMGKGALFFNLLAVCDVERVHVNAAGIHEGCEGDGEYLLSA